MQGVDSSQDLPGVADFEFANIHRTDALAADIQTIPGLPTAPGYLNVDVDTETGEIDGLF